MRSVDVKQLVEKPLKINMRKIIENFLNAYAMTPEDVLVMEAVANSLDAKATEINLKVTGELFAAEDNGRGMTKQEFEEHFAALAISSKEKGGGIGFAGIGAKLYLAIPETEVSLESAKGSSSFSSMLYPRGDQIVWSYNDGERLLSRQGTYYEVKLRRTHELVDEHVREVARVKFNSILMGWYGDKKITVNGTIVDPFSPELNGDPYDETTSSKYGSIRIVYWLTKKPFPEWSGLHIVVHGKTIRSKEWFGFDYDLKPEFRDRIVGFVLADPLSAILTTNKEDISRSSNPLLWSSVQSRIVRSLKEWLQRIDAFSKKEKIESAGPSPLESITQSILNQVLRLPELKEFNPFLGRNLSRVAVTAADPDTGIAPVEGSQLTSGTQRGETDGHGTQTQGDEVGTGYIEKQDSDTQGRIVNRRIRSGILVKFSDEPKEPRECRFSGDVLVINTAHPNYHLAKKYAFEVAHVTRCAFMELVERVHPEAKQYYDVVRQFYGSWSTLEGN